MFVNFSAHRATLKNILIYSECATLYKYVLINQYIINALINDLMKADWKEIYDSDDINCM